MGDNSKERYARLCWLVADVGTQTLRNVFDSFYSPIHLRNNISRFEVKIQVEKIHSQGKITDRQMELLYPTSHKVITSRRFKFDMLIGLLQNICHISPPYPNGWNKLPLPDDKSLSADITRLKVAKDLLRKTDSVLEEEYQEIWTSVTGAILSLDGAEGKRKIYRVQSEILASEYIQDQFINQLRAKEETKSEHPLPEKTKKLLKQRSSMSPFKDIPAMLNPGEGIGEEDTIVLNKTFKQLIETVSVEDVMDSLEENEVLTQAHRDKINAIHRNAPKMRYLLSVIQTTTNTHAFKFFCEAIKEKYTQVHDTIVKIRHQIYKKGTVNKTDLLGYCKNVVVQQYKSMYDNITPLPWEDFTDKRENFFVPLNIFNSECEHISLENLFPKKGTIKVLQGPAGCGKTTLCKMIANKWCKTPESFCTSFDLVLYVDLARVSSSETIIDTIYHQILPDNFKINQANFKSVLETNTAQILFIFDGYVDGCIEENEDVERILKKDLFNGCSVLVMTQPSCSRISKVKVNTFVHTKGLATKNIARCIKTYTSLVEIEEKPLNKFLEALRREQDTIEALRIPLACMYLILQPDDPLPDFDQLSDFNHILKDFLNRLIEKFYTENELLTSAGKVLDSVKKMIARLEEMAYKHLLDGQTLITPAEMESLELESVEKLGIFLPAGTSWQYQCSIWRDYLAARHLVETGDLKFERELEKHQLLHLPQFEQMIKFLCALEALNDESGKLDLIASAYASHNEKHVKGISFSPELLDMLDEEDDIASKRKGQFMDFVPGLSALYASKSQDKMLDTIAASLPPCINLKCSHLFPETALMGLSKVLHLPIQTIVEVDISLHKLHDNQGHSLLKLARAIGQNQHIKTLRVSWLSMNIAAKFLGAVLENNTSIRLVHVERAKGHHRLPSSDTATMYAGLQAASCNMTNVECFRFVNCPYPAVVGHVIRHLPPTLPELDISDCAFDMVCGQRLAYLLEHTAMLHSLDISGVKMGNTEFLAFISGIKLCHTLQVMKVSHARLGREAFLSLCDSLLMAKSIENLDLSGCQLTTEMGTKLAETTEQVKSLKTLNLLNSKITDEGRSLIQISSPRSLKILGIQKRSGLPPIYGGY